jgi:endo-1,4-beta-mannosidase
MKFKINDWRLTCAACSLALIILFQSDQSRAQGNILTEQGNFVVGCNYWASHAGTKMWSDWQPAVIDKDFEELSANGIKVIRIFPLWPDFQPIVQLYGGGGVRKEIAFPDGPLPQDGVGANGMSEEALRKFQVVTDLAKKHNIKLIVGLITGWMIGQLFVPPALEGKNVLTDPTALAWEQRFVKTFVHQFKNNTSIIAWDFGNECNVMGEIENSDQAYVWSALLSGTIKSEDHSRPVVSGMHGLSPASDAHWRIQDQAATTDLLTTHPYPYWTPYTFQDPINTIRTLLHSAAQTRMYADIGNKPCLIEETGVMGPMQADETVQAAFARTLLFSGWANDCHGLLWWCAFDQTSLNHTPYTWVAIERELGLIRNDKSTKPVMHELQQFGTFLKQLPFKSLPLRRADAICVLTEGQDDWAVAYSSFILAKQAGFDLEFQMAGQRLRDAKLYIVPSIHGVANMNKETWLELLEKVKSGASLYLSTETGFVAPFVDPFGLDVVVNSSWIGSASFASKNMQNTLTFDLAAPWKMVLNPRSGVVVLAEEPDGDPIFTETKYGKGELYFLSVPLEMDLTQTPGAFEKNQPGYYKIYQQIGQPIISSRVLRQTNPYIGVTEHALKNDEQVIVLINYSPEAGAANFQLKEGWVIAESLYGRLPTGNKFTINANDALVLLVKSNSQPSHEN